ncbi:hypothetical protein KHC28_00460 [Ancylobacter sonchi]|uniref:hypothetical protein n=1 Tax=Ancylobacter sonchi TaxID=1937790 RepID=UPI001BD30B07|nr:hypothetical protein [Ancylobacter sonchi]MBS7532137.1 hypothetical protein [Ancylobacter sonchi]
MGIAHIAPGPGGDDGVSLRAKLDAVVDAANLVPSKADASALTAESLERSRRIAEEAAARVSGLTAEAAARTLALQQEATARSQALAGEATSRQAALLALPLPVPIKHRPGDAPLDFGRSLAGGEGALVEPLPADMLRDDENGRVVRLTGDDVIAPRHLYPLEPGRRYLATFAFQRRVNSPDPDGDAVRCAVAWFGQGKGRLSLPPQTIVQDMLALTTGAGRQVVRAVISRAAAVNVDIVAPLGARYCRPYIQTYGTLAASDVEVISWADITDVTSYAPDVSALEDRIAAQEGLDLGARLTAIEAATSAPNTYRFASLGGLVAGSVPISADEIEVLGYSAAGDRGHHRRRRVSVANAATIADAEGVLWEIAERVVRPEMVGGTPQAALYAAAAIGAEVDLAPFASYPIAQLVIPSNIVLRTNRAVLATDGTTTGSQIAIDVGDGVRFDGLLVTTPGTETAENIMRLGTGVEGGQIRIFSDAQRARGGITTTGDGVKIDLVRTRKIDRPLHLLNTSIVAQTTGSRIGFLDVEDYVRAFRADFCSFAVGGILARGRSPNASKTPGHNGVLIQGCADWSIGDSVFEDSGEHAFRIGGSPHLGAQTKNFVVGDITARRCGGCAFKINPGLLVGVGVTEVAENGLVGNVFAVDCGNGISEGNTELLRITHARKVHIASAIATVDTYAISAQNALRINDSREVWIGRLGGTAISAGLVSINGTSDVDGITSFGGDVRDLHIANLFGATFGASAIGIETTFAVGDVYIHCEGVTGFTTNLARWISGTVAGPFKITGTVGGSVSPTFQDAPVSEAVTLDIEWNNTRTIGRAAGARVGTAAMEVLAPAFSAASQAATGLFINGAAGTAGEGNAGAGVEFSRLGSSRRGAAIVPIQGSADEKEVGLGFFVGDTNTTANEVLLLALRLLHTGRMLLRSDLPTYANNAAAVGAGLMAGAVYSTSTGELRVVV